MKGHNPHFIPLEFLLEMPESLQSIINTVRFKERKACSLFVFDSKHTYFNQNLCKPISPGNCLQTPQYRHDTDHNTFYYKKLLLQNLVSFYTNIEWKKIRFGKGNFGKPFLLNNPAFKFNLSSSKGLIFLGMSMEDDIGVDIEYIELGFDWLSISDFVLSDLEKEEIMNFGNKLERSRAFYIVWTYKEAFCKYLGCGLDVNLKEIQFPIDTIHRGLFSYQYSAEDISITGGILEENFAFSTVCCSMKTREIYHISG